MHYILISLVFIISQIATLGEVVNYSHEQAEKLIITEDPLFTTEQMAQAEKMLSKTKKKAIKAVDAENIFKKNCQSCHGRKGGLGLAGAANLKKSVYSLEERIAMVYYGRKTMQAYSPALSDAEIIAVATYLETLRK